MTKLLDILSKYDNPDKKGFDYYEVEAEINALPKDVTDTDEVQAEMFAMMFQDNAGKSDWNTYYGPMIFGTRTNKETGEKEPYYIPDYRQLTAKHFAYWEKRAEQTCNPLMKMRYLGLIFDLQKELLKVEPDYQKVKLLYIETIIQVIQGEYYRYEVEGVTFAERALHCATALKNTDLIGKAKNAVLLLNQRYKDDDESSGLWGRCFQLMLDYRSAFIEKEVRQMVDEAELRFYRIEKLTLSEGCSTDKYAHLLKEQAELLCQYYSKYGQKDKIENLLDRVCVAIHLSANARGKIWLHAMLREMQVLYRRYHLEKKAKQLYVDLQNVSSEDIWQEMELIESQFCLEKDLTEPFINDFLSGSNEDILRRYIILHIPNLAKEKQIQLEESKRSLPFDLIPTTTYDAMGNPINHVGVGKDVEHQMFRHKMQYRMQFSAILLRLIVDKMIEKNIFTYESVMQAFEGSIVLSIDQKPLFERGVRAYFEGDYMVTCHLLVPLFESAIRRLVASQGGEILQHNQDPIEGNRYISLDGLLESEVLKNLFPEDVLVYFQNLFTDHNGWNLRNLISHGLLTADSFNSIVSDRIVHAFMVLSMLKTQQTK